jgi:hypothetical protein
LCTQLIAGNGLTQALIADTLVAIVAFAAIQYATAAVGKTPALCARAIAARWITGLWPALICGHAPADVVAAARATVELIIATIRDGTTIGFFFVASGRNAITAIRGGYAAAIR